MLTIDYRSGESLYIQIKNNYKKMIMSGSLKENEMLPSVRTLAGNLAINVNTVQRAYRELEQEGYIYSVPGKGNFVAKIDKSIINKGYNEFRDQVLTTSFFLLPSFIARTFFSKASWIYGPFLNERLIISKV